MGFCNCRTRSSGGVLLSVEIAVPALRHGDPSMASHPRSWTGFFQAKKPDGSPASGRIDSWASSLIHLRLPKRDTAGRHVRNGIDDLETR